MNEYATQTGRVGHQRAAILRSFYWALREGNYKKANRIKDANLDWISFREFDTIAGKVMHEQRNRREVHEVQEVEETPPVRSVSSGELRECES